MNMDYQQENNYPKAIAATSVIIAALVALCYFIVFENPPLKDVGTGGILVNYGTTDEGSGKDISSTEQPSASPKANHTAPDKVTDAPSTEQKTEQPNHDKNLVTQNTEDAPEVASSSKKSKPTEAAQPTKPAKKEVVNPAAIYNPHSSKGTGGGDGTTTATGNQGSPNGSTLANNYGPGGSGNGLNLPPSWRFATGYPTIPANPHRVQGTVMIDFTIDQNGNVIQTNIDRNSRAELTLEQNCENAIKNSKFTSSAPASGNQRGKMTFIIKVD